MHPWNRVVGNSEQFNTTRADAARAPSPDRCCGGVSQSSEYFRRLDNARDEGSSHAGIINLPHFQSPHCHYLSLLIEPYWPYFKWSLLAFQVLQRIDDVSIMCEKRKAMLKQQLLKAVRPVQTVSPEPIKSISPVIQYIKPGRILKKANTMPRVSLFF